ncbi:Clp protease N-terminal domain-containing protein [Humibacter sp. RRB41]|uniref:Clp protease N-terminal domain-containing protein n=1 Tax=Humibacter sp. RRB41 TaxID=2919946 RepID=UPI001FA95D21|nr:Clp protease N-terminal domain-containing protein [Humibacter sp. RRB41]
MDVDVDRIPQSLRPVVVSAVEEAARRSSSEVGPEHLLLALAALEGTLAADILSDVGLSHAALDAALDEERTRALAVVGIHDLDPELVAATIGTARPSWASSTREALRRSQAAGARGRRRRTFDLDVLYGIVTANVGTVPRALEYAAIDRDALIGRVERERLAAEGDLPRTAHQGGSAQERQAMRRDAARAMQDDRRAAQRAAQVARREAQQARGESRRSD